jgi:hypothetical protein
MVRALTAPIFNRKIADVKAHTGAGPLFREEIFPPNVPSISEPTHF